MATNKVTTNVIDMSGNTGGLVWAKGTTAERPTGVAGDVRLNTTDSRLEYKDNVDWKRFSEGAATPSVAFQADFLVVAGGGAGGRASGIGGGGGGAGGLRTSFGSTSGGGSSNESKVGIALSTSYTVTVGAGGSGPTSGDTSGPSGSDSVFATITSLGGGGGTTNNPAGISGGSGGGAYQPSPSAGGAGTANQGFDGGYCESGSSSGGGGGAGGAGANSHYLTPLLGNGGVGLAVSITGSSVTYAGGGGGGRYASEAGGPGAGGSGIGGNGGNGGAGGNGTANTGSGGGGAANSQNGGSGGSGIVIVRYPNTYTISVGSGLTSSTTTDGSDKITTFTAGSDTVSFS